MIWCLFVFWWTMLNDLVFVLPICLVFSCFLNFMLLFVRVSLRMRSCLFLFFPLTFICLTWPKFQHAILKKDRANLGPSLKHKRASSRKLPGFIKAYVFIYYIGLKKKTVVLTPPLQCLLPAGSAVFLPGSSLFKLWNPHVCLLFSSAGTATEGLIRTGIRSQAKGIQGSTECFSVPITGNSNITSNHGNKEVSKIPTRY